MAGMPAAAGAARARGLLDSIRKLLATLVSIVDTRLHLLIGISRFKSVY